MPALSAPSSVDIASSGVCDLGKICLQKCARAPFDGTWYANRSYRAGLAQCLGRIAVHIVVERASLVAVEVGPNTTWSPGHLSRLGANTQSAPTDNLFCNCVDACDYTEQA